MVLKISLQTKGVSRFLKTIYTAMPKIMWAWVRRAARMEIYPPIHCLDRNIVYNHLLHLSCLPLMCTWDTEEDAACSQRLPLPAFPGPRVWMQFQDVSFQKPQTCARPGADINKFNASRRHVNQSSFARRQLPARAMTFSSLFLIRITRYYSLPMTGTKLP